MRDRFLNVLPSDFAFLRPSQLRCKRGVAADSHLLKPPSEKIGSEKKQRQDEHDADQETGVHAALRSLVIRRSWWRDRCRSR